MLRALAALLLAACASAPHSSSTTPGSSVGESTEASGREPGDPRDAAKSDGRDSAERAPDAVPSGPPPGTPSLPEVNVRNVGLHVGGGRNDAASKAPFLSTLERHHPDFLRCYRLVEEPGTQGTFGVDLHVGRKGVVERVEQPRPGLPGDEFRDCMVRVFEKVQFEPMSSPVVISYSVRFSVRE